MSRHMPYELAQMQSLPLEAKIRMTQERIRQWHEHWDGQVYVSFSGGKDSTVLKHIVDGMYDDVPSLFVNTGLEYPEIQKFARAQKNVVTVRPDLSFVEVVKTYGYPVISKEVSNTISGARNSIKKGQYSLRLRQLGVMPEEYGGLQVSDEYDYEKTVQKSKFRQDKWRYLLDAKFLVSDKCCYHMKKKPLHKYEKETGRKPLVATLACESMTRHAAWLKNGCNAFNAQRPTSQPLSFWTEQDILTYLKLKEVPYCSVYGDIVTTDAEGNFYEMPLGYFKEIYALGLLPELTTSGCDRTGCIFCMFGCHLEKEPNRFQQLKKTHPRQYEYCIGGGKTVDGVWQPSKEGMGLGKVLDYIGVEY